MKGKYLFKIIYILIISILFLSCTKDKTPEELIHGNYFLEYASINGEDVTGFLINDSIKLTSLYAAKVEDLTPFQFYFAKNQGVEYIFQGGFTFINNSQLRISNKGWAGIPDSTILENIAFLPFSKQDKIVLNIETLNENQLVFNTLFSDKKYRYEFKE